jgi:hypothetical protein
MNVVAIMDKCDYTMNNRSWPGRKSGFKYLWKQEEKVC